MRQNQSKRYNPSIYKFMCNSRCAHQPWCTQDSISAPAQVKRATAAPEAAAAAERPCKRAPAAAAAAAAEQPCKKKAKQAAVNAKQLTAAKNTKRSYATAVATYVITFVH